MYKAPCVIQIIFQPVVCSPWQTLVPSYHLRKQGYWMKTFQCQLLIGCIYPSRLFHAVVRSVKGTYSVFYSVPKKDVKDPFQCTW